jgi:hypothetical protein
VKESEGEDAQIVLGIERMGRGQVFQALGLEEVRIAPRSPWQSPDAERLIGSIRRECLDHVIVLNRAHLYRLLKAYSAYDHRSQTHLALDKDAPEPRAVQGPEEVKTFPTLEATLDHLEYLRPGKPTPTHRMEKLPV